MTVPSWTALLDEYEATIAALEAAVATGADPAVTPWRAPATVPTRTPTAEERERFAALQARAARCVDLLRAALDETGSGIETVRRTGAAARAYGRVEHLTGA